MANIRSQIKRNKTNEARRVRNKTVRSSVRTSIKRFESAVEGGDQEIARQALGEATKALDQATAKGVIHANRAANKKSALARRLNSAS